MKPLRSFVLIILIFSVFYSCSREKYDLIIQKVSVIDVKKGVVLGDMDVGIAGGQIAAIGKSLTPTVDLTTTIDGQGKYVIPGLCDSHTHLAFLTITGGDTLKNQLADFVRHGVLFVRDVGGPIDIMQKMKEQTVSGEMEGPDIYYTGPMLESSPLYWEKYNEYLPGFTVALENEEDVDEVLPDLAARGAIIIKTFYKTKPELYPHIVEVARRYHLKIVHDPGPPLLQWIPVDVALEQGVTSFEHATAPLPCILNDELKALNDSLTRPETSAEERGRLMAVVASQGLGAISEQRLEELTRAMKQHNAVLCPTLHVAKDFEDELQSAGDDSVISEEQQRLKIFSELLHSVGYYIVNHFSENGIRLLAGQDNSRPEGTFEEMLLLKEAGVPDLEILRAATLYPAEWLEADDRYGTVEPGKAADLVLLNGNPLEDISFAGDIHGVIQKGRVVPMDVSQK